MPKVVGITFEEGGKVFYFRPMNEEVEIGEKVVVETSRGMEMGKTATKTIDIPEEKIVEPLMPIVRRATEKDFKVLQEMEGKKSEIVRLTNDLIKKYKLEMKVVDVEFTVDGQKTIINFVCEDRVDFRDLVKELASTLKQRIELRQIGIRAHAKLVGGI